MNTADTQSKKLLMISTDRRIFEEGSAVRERQVEYAKNWGEVHIVIFGNLKSQKLNLKAEDALAPNCFAYSTRSRFKLLYPFDAIRLGRFICKGRGITNITCQDSSLTAMVGVALKKEFKLPLEIQIHEDIGSPYYAHRVSNRIRKSLALKYLPQADYIRVVSNRIKTYLTDMLKISAAKIEVRPIQVNVVWIKNAQITPGADLHKKYPQFEKIVLMASRIEKEKNIDAAIQAWPEVVEKIPKAGLVIVGEGSMSSKLKGQSAKLKVQGSRSVNESIVFESWADQATLASYYKTADLFLNVSLFEGYGMTLAEAQAAGCEIVSTDVGIASEVGAIITAADSGAVAKALIDALT